MEESVMKTLKSLKDLEGNVFGLKKTKAVKKSKKKFMPKKTKTVTCTYEVLGIYECTVIRVPKRDKKHMKYVPATTIDNVSISEHWRNSKGLGGDVYLNVFFYNITKKHLDELIVATVEVIKKTMLDDGRKFIILNVHHTPEKKDSCKYTFMMPKDGRGDYDIHPGVEEQIYFHPRKHNLIRL